MAPLPRLLVVVTLAEAGGAQTFVASLVRGLADRWDIDVAAHGPDGALVDACAEVGVPFHHVEHLRRDPDPVHDLLALRELRALALELEPEVVQLNSSKAGTLVRVALAGTGIPVAFTAHGWAFSGRQGLDGTAWTAIERATAPLAAAVVCVSGWDLHLARERSVGDSRLHLIHNGIEPGPLPDRGPWPEEPVLACTARLAPPKDLLTLLDALTRPGNERWRLQVIGDGPDRPAIEERRAALGLEGRVELLGHRDDVPALLAAADAFVLPTDWEGLPYAVLEAMAAGLPVVASAVGGIPEMVVPGETGALVPRRDADALGAALAELAADGERARALGAAGHRRAGTRFGLRRMVDRYDALLRSLARGR